MKSTHPLATSLLLVMLASGVSCSSVQVWSTPTKDVHAPAPSGEVFLFPHLPAGSQILGRIRVETEKDPYIDGATLQEVAIKLRREATKLGANGICLLEEEKGKYTDTQPAIYYEHEDVHTHPNAFEPTVTTTTHFTRFLAAAVLVTPADSGSLGMSPRSDEQFAAGLRGLLIKSKHSHQ